jgi:hypothetical protein
MGHVSRQMLLRLTDVSTTVALENYVLTSRARADSSSKAPVPPLFMGSMKKNSSTIHAVTQC